MTGGVTVGTAPIRVAFSADGKLALVPNLGTWDVTIISVHEKKALGSVRVGSSPVGVVVTPDSRKAYVAVYGENVVAVIDLKSLEVVKRIPTGLGPVGIAIALGPIGLKLMIVTVQGFRVHGSRFRVQRCRWPGSLPDKSKKKLCRFVSVVFGSWKRFITAITRTIVAGSHSHQTLYTA